MTADPGSVAPTPSPAAICFDLDETLLDRRGLEPSIWTTCELVARRMPGIDADALLAANRTAWHDYWATAEPAWIVGALDGATLATEAWRRTLAAVGAAEADLVEYAAETHARLAREAHRLFDDAAPAIGALRSRGMGLGLISNGASDTQREKLQTLEIEQWFDVVIISGEIGAAKPDPAPFVAAVEALGVPAGEVWHVGDDLEADVGGANAAGLVSVWLNRDRRSRQPGDPGPAYEIRSLADLSSALF